MNFLRSKKGFTLVEIIVVLVIIAILAAISLPALTGYIKDAREKSAIAEARTVLVAMQTISSTKIGQDGQSTETVATFLSGTGGADRIKELTGMTTVKGITIATAGISAEGNILTFTYASTPPVTYASGAFTPATT